MIGALLAVALEAPSGFVALDEVDPTILQEFGLTRCTAPYRRRFPGNSVNMGTGYDCFDPGTPG